MFMARVCAGLKSLPCWCLLRVGRTCRQVIQSFLEFLLQPTRSEVRTEIGVSISWHVLSDLCVMIHAQDAADEDHAAGKHEVHSGMVLRMAR